MAIEGVFREAGHPPSFIDAHIYEDPKATIGRRSEILADFAATHQRPYIIGEFHIRRPDLLADLWQSLRRAAAQPRAVLYWPLRFRSTGCRADYPEALK